MRDVGYGGGGSGGGGSCTQGKWILADAPSPSSNQTPPGLDVRVGGLDLGSLKATFVV